MRSRKLAALVAIIAGGVWIASGILSWDTDGLSDLSEQLWWGGVGAFALASALVGYSSVTTSPIWLRIVVFVGAAVLGGSIVSSVDTDMANMHLVLVAAGAFLVVLGLAGLAAGGGGRDEPEEPTHRGRRAAR